MSGLNGAPLFAHAAATVYVCSSRRHRASVHSVRHCSTARQPTPARARRHCARLCAATQHCGPRLRAAVHQLSCVQGELSDGASLAHSGCCQNPPPYGYIQRNRSLLLNLAELAATARYCGETPLFECRDANSRERAEASLARACAVVGDTVSLSVVGPQHAGELKCRTAHCVRVEHIGKSQLITTIASAVQGRVAEAAIVNKQIINALVDCYL